MRASQFTGIIGAMSTPKRFHLFLLCAFFLAACSTSAAGSTLPAVFPSSTPNPTGTPLPPTATSIPMAATVNGEGITLDDLNAEVARYKTAQAALGKEVNDQDAAKIVLDDLVDQVLLSQGAAEAGFTVDDPALQARVDALAAQVGGADKLLAWQQAHGYDHASFRAALKRAVAAAWMRDKIISAVPSTAEQVHVRQVLLYNEDVAKSIWNQLQAGVNFDNMAALIDPVTRGDIGWFPRGYLAQKTIEDAAFSLEVGKYSDVIKSEVGFHIIMVIERQPDRTLSPDALLSMQNQALANWLANRRQQANIVLTAK